MYCQLDYAALAGDDHITFSLTSCRRIVSLSTHTLIIATTGASAYISHLLPPPLCRSFLRIDSVVTASEGGVSNAGIGVQGRPSCLQRYEGSGGGGGGQILILCIQILKLCFGSKIILRILFALKSYCYFRLGENEKYIWCNMM